MPCDRRSKQLNNVAAKTAVVVTEAEATAVAETEVAGTAVEDVNLRANTNHTGTWKINESEPQAIAACGFFLNWFNGHRCLSKQAQTDYY